MTLQASVRFRPQNFNSASLNRNQLIARPKASALQLKIFFVAEYVIFATPLCCALQIIDILQKQIKNKQKTCNDEIEQTEKSIINSNCKYEMELIL